MRKCFFPSVNISITITLSHQSWLQTFIHSLRAFLCGTNSKLQQILTADPLAISSCCLPLLRIQMTTTVWNKLFCKTAKKRAQYNNTKRALSESFSGNQNSYRKIAHVLKLIQNTLITMEHIQEYQQRSTRYGPYKQLSLKKAEPKYVTYITGILCACKHSYCFFKDHSAIAHQQLALKVCSRHK